MVKITVTRKDLYDLVWSEPMSSLSKKYKISDAGLRKICIGMSIPLPRAGHWENLRAGEPVSITPLPTTYDGEPSATLTLRKETDSQSQQENPVQELQEIPGDNSNISVPERPSLPDKRILAARASLTEKKRYIDKGLVNTYRDQLDIKVAPENVGRALRFMDSIIKAVEARGHSLQIQDNTTYVVIDNQRMKISLRERLKTGPGKTDWGSKEYHPTGKLYFKLDSYPYAEWRDGMKLLEEQFPEIVTRLEMQGKELLAEQLQWKKIREEQENEERLKREFRQRKEKELDDFKKILQEASRWHQAKMLRNYINAIEEKTLADNAIPGELNNRLEWARKKADWYDPMVEAEDELLKDVDKGNLVFKGTHF